MWGTVGDWKKLQIQSKIEKCLKLNDWKQNIRMLTHFEKSYLED